MRVILSLNFGLLSSYLLGMMKNNFDFGGKLKIGAFAVGFPIIGSILQLLILPFVYDSPDSLGKHSNILTAMLRTMRLSPFSRIFGSVAVKF